MIIERELIDDYIDRTVPAHLNFVKKIFNEYTYCMLNESNITQNLEDVDDYFNPFSDLGWNSYILYDDRLKFYSQYPIRNLIASSIQLLDLNFFKYFYATFYEHFDLSYIDICGNVFQDVFNFSTIDVGDFYTDEGYVTDGIPQLYSVLLRFYFEFSELALCKENEYYVRTLISIMKPARLFFFSEPVFIFRMSNISNYITGGYINLITSLTGGLTVSTDKGLLTDRGVKTDMSVSTILEFYIKISYRYAGDVTDRVTTVIPKINEFTLYYDLFWEFPIEKSITYLKIEGPSVLLECDIMGENYISPVTYSGKSKFQVFWRLNK